MTLASDIVQAALREGNIIPVGAVSTGAEQSEALDALNRAISSIYGYELGENLSDWEYPAPQRTAPVAANYPALPYPLDSSVDLFPLPFSNNLTANIYPYPPVNSRIVFGNVTGKLYFSDHPADGARMALIQGTGAGDGGVAGAVITLDGNGRTIGGAATQSYTVPLTARNWFYRADLGDWQSVTTLALTDTMPFPVDFDDFFICALALRLAPRYGKTTAPETIKTAADTLKRLKARYTQTAVTVYGSEDIPRGLESYISGVWWW